MGPATSSLISEGTTDATGHVSCMELTGSSLSENAFDKLFTGLKDAVLAKKPVLKEILEKHGHKMLYDYAKDYIDVNLNPPIALRQEQLLSVVEKETSRLLGPKVAASVVKQLSQYYFVSTADHHGPLTHPFFINSNLLIATPFGEYNETLDNVIVLACAAVSQNNSSFPRGVVFHSKADDGSTHFNSTAFFAAQYRLCPVYNFKPYDKNDLKNLHKGIAERVKSGCMDQATANKFNDIFAEIYEQDDILSCKSYGDQVTKTNYTLWKKLLGSSKGTTRVPNLVYLEIESIVSQLILEFHLNEDTTINHFLFDPECDPLINEYFQGITGTFSVADNWGTYMFWALPKGERYRMGLKKIGNKLVTDDGKYSYDITPEAIREGLLSKELIPSSMLVYTVLCFYYGLKCLGGFSQVNYLTFMKNAYIKMQVDRGKYRSIEVCARAQTKEIVGDVNVAFLETAAGELVPATGIDLLLYGKENWWQLFVEESKNISLTEAMNPMMPELYSIIYPEAERNKELLTISAEDITRHTNLREKIAPCASL